MASRLVGLRSTGALSINRVNHVRNHVPMRFPAGTYDELTIPQGSWDETYKKRNAFYNRFLLISSVVLIFMSASVR
ncbi:unnamed protein product [Heterobilharzia americana]|nr:unnamed protein product [Heterobilharzia americana]